jgi:hypothetical protein
MYMMLFRAALTLLLVGGQLGAAPKLGRETSPSRTPGGVERLLRDKDQALLNAIGAGDAKTWDRALAFGAIYVDENGEVMQRDQLLKQMMPLPAGTSGSIKIVSYRLELHGDVAIVIHTDDEEENYHGQSLTARYLTTETWQKSAADWKLLCAHTYAVLRDPPAIALGPAELDGYTGRYAAGDLIYVIRRDGDHLVGAREERPAAQLNAEVRDVFFIKGQPRNRKMFQRDQHGQVSGFSDRREGVDLAWKRIGSIQP